MAETIQMKGMDGVHVWMTIEGADLCKKNVPEKIVSPIFSKFGSAMQIMDRVRQGPVECKPTGPILYKVQEREVDYAKRIARGRLRRRRSGGRGGSWCGGHGKAAYAHHR
jgi:hypothetical protein